MPARGNQSAPVRWSPVESGGVQWIQVDCSPVESTGLPTGLESSGVHRIANWTGVHRSPPDCQSSSLGGPILILAGTESSWSPVESTGVQLDSVGEGKGLVQGPEVPIVME